MRVLLSLWQRHVWTLCSQAKKMWSEALWSYTWQVIHIEVTFNLDADSFVLTLRKLVVRRGNVKSVYSDIGSNFIGAERELKKAYSEMNDDKIQ